MLHKLRKIVVAVGTAAMLFGTMGAIGASAQTSSTVVTRAQFVYNFDVANNLAPVYPATPSFSDVPASSPYYGYIEAAFQAGWIDGVGGGMFDPSGSLTRAQVTKIEVIALGDGAAALADMNMATTFTDNSTIPSWARGYIVEAVKLGLVKGYPNGSFAPNGTVSTSDEPFFLAQYKAVSSQTAFTISAAPSDVAVGQAATLAESGTTQTVTYSVNSTSAAINGNTFIASAAGNYTVTGMTASGASASTVVHVYGSVSSYTIKGPSSIVANGASTASYTVTAVDANGNTVANYNATATVAYATNGNDGAVSLPTTTTFLVQNGVGSFTVTAKTTAGRTDTLSVTDGTTTGLTGSVSITTTAQVATSVALTAATPTVSENSSTSDEVTATINDQTGNPMLTGTYSVAISVAGANSTINTSNTSGATTTSVTAVASGTGSAQTAATAYVFSAAGYLGTITVSATSGSLTSTPTTITAVSTGAASAISLSATSLTTTEGTPVALTITSVDAHGYAVDFASAGSITVSTTSGDTFLANSSTDAVQAYSTTASETQATVYLDDHTAGTRTVTVSAGGFTATLTLVTNPSAPTSLSVTPASGTQIDVPVTAPSGTVTLQLVDTHSNNSPEAGVTADVYATSSGGYNVWLNGTDGYTSGSPLAVTTNSSGTATVTLKDSAYVGDVVTVYSKLPAQGTITGTAWAAAGTFKVVNTVVSSVQVSYTTSSGGSVGVSTAGSTVGVLVTTNDSGGNAVSVPFSDLSFSLNGNAMTCSSGTCTDSVSNSTVTSTVYWTGNPDYTFTPHGSGTNTLTVTVTNQQPNVSGSASLSVVAGTIDYATITSPTSSSSSPVAVTGNTPIAFTVSATDANGNAGVAPSGGLTVNLAASVAGGSFRLTSNGNAISGTTVTIAAGTSSLTVYYVPPAESSATADTVSAYTSTQTTSNESNLYLTVNP